MLTSDSRLLDNFAFFGCKAVTFPAWETLPHEGIPPSPDVVGERYRTLRSLQQEPTIICTSLQAVLQKVLTPKRLDILYL